jgi:hypothetical protein
MGLLDDAIREHLDLKRRRGADPAEVARMEQDALGPVRREPAPADAASDEAATAPPAAEPPAAESQQPAPKPHAADEAFPADDRTRVLPPEERHEGAHGDPLRDHVPHEPAATPEPEPEPAPPAQEPPPAPAEDPRHSDVVHQPTTEFRVEDHHDEDEPPQGGRAADDVLEETPDFLQETPEHDRLWFEQRPPRDFDFDG